MTPLTPEQINFVIQKVGEWLRVGGTNRSDVDASHSALLHRLLSGKNAFPKPPPCKMSYPWYELSEGKKIELDRDFDKITIVGDLVHVGNSGPFMYLDKQASPDLLVYPPSGEIFQITLENDKTFIQKVIQKSFRPLEEGGKWTGCEGCGSPDCDGKCR